MKRTITCLSFASLLFFGNVLFAQKWDTLAPIPESFTFPVVAVADGKIHIMGGGGVGGATNHHFAYDPLTDTWASRAPVPYLAQQPAGATANGKIHFFGGGYPNSGSPVDKHHVYDPVTDSWAVAAKLTAPRAIHYAVTLNEVLFSLAGQGMTNLCQTYDPVADAWTTKNTLPDGSFFYGAHLATEGSIWRFGGGGYSAPKNFAHRYNPVTDTWTTLPSLPKANHGLRGAAIGTKIWLAGGYYDFLERDEVLIFDTETKTYSDGPKLPLGRNYHNMVAIDSCIYVMGGNHAIDATVTFQLLRLCPFETSATREGKALLSPLNAQFFDGNLFLKMPADGSTPAQLSIFDLTGRQVFAQNLTAVYGERAEIRVGELPPAIYFIRLETRNGVFSGKFSAN